MLPRKSVHALRLIREALGKSRLQFAPMLGVSLSLLEKIEGNDRPITDELADEIEVGYGVDAQCLKQGKLLPWIDRQGIVQFGLLGEPWKRRHLPKHIVKEYDSLRRIKDKRERLRQVILLWKKIMADAPGFDHRFLDEKLSLLFEAARQEGKSYAIAMRLYRWTENTIQDFHLRKGMNTLASRRAALRRDMGGPWGRFYPPKKRRRRKR
jgi:transcriptional regulator with XRE-family HTH domain